MRIILTYLYYKSLLFFGLFSKHPEYDFSQTQTHKEALSLKLYEYNQFTSGTIREQISGFLLFEPYKKYLGEKDPVLLESFVFKKQSNMIYLTIDDGPSSAGKKMTEYLIEKNIPATFFLLCKNMHEKSLEKYMHPLFSIGSHSYDHKNFDRYSATSLDKDFGKCKDIFATYKIPYTMMRPPYGIVNQHVVDMLRNYNLSGILRDSDIYDRGTQAGFSGDTLLNAIRPGSILLLHEQMKFEDFVSLIELLQTSGFTFGKL